MRRNTPKVHIGKSTLLMVFALFLSVSLLGGCAGQAGPGSAVVSQANARLVALGDGICVHPDSGKMWQVGRSETFTSLAEAKAYVSALKVGGYDDWRLPTVAELYDLYLIFDLHENGDCGLEAEGIYWSDEPDLEGNVGTWELDDNCDPERRYIPKQMGKVRAIRP